MTNPLSPDWPSAKVRSVPAPLQLPSNVNCWVEPSGKVCLVTMILPSLVLLNVHVTVWPAEMTTLGSVRPWSQLDDVSDQPTGTVSAMG